MLSFQTGVCCGCVTPENFEHIEAKWCSLLHSRGKESTQSIMINHKFMWPKFEKKILSIFHYNFWTVFVGKFLRFWTIFIATWQNFAGTLFSFYKQPGRQVKILASGMVPWSWTWIPVIQSLKSRRLSNP